MYIFIFDKRNNVRAIEINSKTDKKGRLKIDYDLIQKNTNVRVLILLDEQDDESKEEKIWLSSILNNSAFDFLKDEEEDIYSITDGKPLND